jgi:penicillin-binding protein 1A
MPLPSRFGAALALLARRLAPAGQALRAHRWRLLAVLALLPVAYLLALVPLTPSTDDLRKARAEHPAVLLSADGVVLATFQRLHRRWVPLEQVAPVAVQALVATEDHRFWDHHGIDLRRTAASAWHTLNGRRQGGSTLTQQLARNLFPEEIGRAPTLHRKAKELVTALKIEAAYGKREILETYLNTVPFLYNAYGIEMAARTYFDKDARSLDVLEAATLVGMLKGTTYYNPVLHPARARERRNVVLAQMARRGVLPAAQAQALAARPLKIDFERQEEVAGLAPHAAQHVRRWLVGWADRNGYDIHADGLVVHTTLDSRLQKAALQAVSGQLRALQPLAAKRPQPGGARAPLQAGFLAMDPRNGHLLAWVGSSGWSEDAWDHVAQARRQPGSTFKPFVYGAAFMEGLRPDDQLPDMPVALRGARGEVWSPKDATPPTGRPMALREALAQSRNGVTAQLMERVGPHRVAELARALGVRDSPLAEVPALALGASAVSLQELVAAYATLAHSGERREPLLVLRIEDRHGKVLDGFATGRSVQAMPRPAALQLVDALRGVVDRGTGSAIRSRHGIGADVAGKTGTSQDNADGWFVLMHPQLVAGAWVGFNDPAVTMGDAWGPGSRSALPIVGEFFGQALRARRIDAQAEFEIPRPRPKPREEEGDPVTRLLQDVVGRVLRILQ